MKNVLFISPTPTHPTNAGNRAHIKSLVAFFKEQNYDVHFLLLAYEDYDRKAMADFFGKNLVIVDRKCIYQNKKTGIYILWKAARKVNTLKRKIQRFIGKISNDQYLYNNEVDNYFSVFAGAEIRKQAKTNKYDIVVCEYASMSKSLTYFGKEVFKILDTHDLFIDRFKIFLKSGMKPSWISLFKDQEQKAIRRADLVLAVQENDKKKLTTLTNVDIAVYNYVPEIVMLPKRIFEKKLLYLASGNKINIASIYFFIEKIFPLLLDTDPDTTLIIGGEICDFLEIKNHNVVLHGKVNEVKDFYCLGDIVINPEKDGTGYKVKALEALAHGMPLVSTSAGAAGVSEPFQNHLFIADEHEEFALAIRNIFYDQQILKTTSLNAQRWIKDYKGKITNGLLTHILN